MTKISIWRVKVVHLLFITIVLFIVGFLFRWQILEYDRYRILANQRIKDFQLSSLRGSILAADGSPFAYSVPVYDVYAYLIEIEYNEDLSRQTRGEFISKVSNVLDTDEDELKNKLAGDAVYVILMREISVETKDALESLVTDINSDKKLVGLHFEPNEKRIYPDKSLAAHLLGFVGKNSTGDCIGRNGVEGYWHGDLAWKQGFIIAETDSFGNQILTGKYEPVLPKVGRSVRLTIDRGVQEIVERKIQEGVERWDAKSGSVLVMQPVTGKILAMATYPTYDPNKYWEVEDYNLFKNRVVSDAYEFGSVGKCFTIAAAMDLKLVAPDTEIFAYHDGCVSLTEEQEICVASKKPAGPMDTTDVLIYSDNIGAYFIAEKLGAEKMYEYFRSFGIGAKTNVGLADESTSVLKDAEQWNLADLATYSYGQGYSATMLQITSGLSAIANKGKRMAPIIVSKVYDEEKDIEIEPYIESEPLSSESAMTVNEMLTEVFEKNGSKWSFPELSNYKLAGKSGTASVLAETGLSYAEDKVNVTFAGWDSSDNPKFIMLVKLEEPGGAPFSVNSVQPLWMEVFLEIRDFIGVIPIVK